MTDAANNPVPLVERVARSLCELHIRQVRRFDTQPNKLEVMMASAVDHAWADFLDAATAALSAIPVPVEVRALIAEIEVADAYNRAHYERDPLHQRVATALAQQAVTIAAHEAALRFIQNEGGQMESRVAREALGKE